MAVPGLPIPEKIADDGERACYNCAWFRFAEELPEEDDGVAIGHCWALPVKPPVKAAWDACHYWKRCKEDLH